MPPAVPPLAGVPLALDATRGAPHHRARAVRQVVEPLPLIRRLARAEPPLTAAHPLGELALVDVAVGGAAQPAAARLAVLKLARVDVAVGALAPPGLIAQVARHKPADAAVAVRVDNVRKSASGMTLRRCIMNCWSELREMSFEARAASSVLRMTSSSLDICAA